MDSNVPMIQKAAICGSIIPSFRKEELGSGSNLHCTRFCNWTGRRKYKFGWTSLETGSKSRPKFLTLRFYLKQVSKLSERKILSSLSYFHQEVFLSFSWPREIILPDYQISAIIQIKILTQVIMKAMEIYILARDRSFPSNLSNGIFFMKPHQNYHVVLLTF